MAVQLSVVIPMYNEAESVDALLEEVVEALDGMDFEIIAVDDGSVDATGARLQALQSTLPQLRVLRHRTNAGQSAGIITGVKAARGHWIATLDGDGQNAPENIPELLAQAEANAAPSEPLLVAGVRRKRNDTGLRRLSSRIANAVRQSVLNDRCADTGCGLKVFGSQAFLELPHFNHMHRFLPALFLRAGGRVINCPVDHRPRFRGESKYGVWNRLWVGIVDLFGVMWLQRRPCRVDVEYESE